jgi:hypothetical protein
MTPFIGVRISWLMLARNSLFARLAASAAFFAVLSSASACLRSVTSWEMPTPRTGLPYSSSKQPVPLNHRTVPSGRNDRFCTEKSAPDRAASANVSRTASRSSG